MRRASTHQIRWLALLAVAALAVAPGLASAKPLVPPAAPTVASDYSAVSVPPGSADLFAVKQRFTKPGQDSVVRRHHGKWTAIAIAGPKSAGQTDYYYTAIAAGSASRVWVAGGSVVSGVPHEVLLNEWTGHGEFRPVALHLGSGVSDLDTIAASSPTNAWAGGYYDGDRPLMLHWNGKSWHVVKVLDESEQFTIDDIAVSSPDNAWAIASNQGERILLHWDGARWWPLDYAAPANGYMYLSTLATTGPDRAFAVGGNEDSPYQNLTAAWDGRTWSLQSVPNPSGVLGIRVVTAVGSKAWALACKCLGPDDNSTVGFRSTRHGWKSQHPVEVGDDSQLSAISGSSKLVAAVGYFTDSHGLFEPLVERLVGNKWKRIAAPD